MSENIETKITSIRTKMNGLLVDINETLEGTYDNLFDAVQALKEGYGSSIDLSDVENYASASDVASGKKFLGQNGEITNGSVTERISEDVSHELAAGATTTALRTKVSAGIYRSDTYKQIPTENANITHANILAASDDSTHTKTFGHNEGVLINRIVVNGDPNLIASNIRSGISIFGRTGTYTGGNIATATATATSTDGTNLIKTLGFTVSGVPTWFTLYAATNNYEFSIAGSSNFVLSAVRDASSSPINVTYYTAAYGNSGGIYAITLTMHSSTAYMSGFYDNGTFTLSVQSIGSSLKFIPNLTYSLLYSY